MSTANPPSTLPATVNLSAYRGDTWSQQFRLRHGDVPEDLSGATVASEARNTKGVVFGLTVTIDNAVAGLFSVGLPAAPNDLPPDSYTYDVEVTKSGVVTTWIRGRLTVTRDVTNEP